MVELSPDPTLPTMQIQQSSGGEKETGQQAALQSSSFSFTTFIHKTKPKRKKRRASHPHFSHSICTRTHHSRYVAT